jgi:hypothetical protein
MIYTLKNSLKKCLVLLPLLLVLAPGCNSNEKKQAGETVGTLFNWEENRTLPLYLLYTPTGQNSSELRAHRQRFEAANIPVEAAAYFPARFSRTEKDWNCIVETGLSWKITSSDDLGSKLLKYQVEISGSTASPGPGNRYKVSFPLSSLSRNSKARQPEIYALEQGSLQSGVHSGYAQLESLSYDSKSKTFQGSVIIYR